MQHLRFIVFSVCLIACFSILGQEFGGFYQDHFRYKELSIKNRRFKHADIQAVIQSLSQFNTSVVGRSEEGRSIYLASYGAGPKSILLWSQMHGNEPTATMALMDIFRFLEADDSYNELRDQLKEDLTIHFIPMLNPDGAERFQRRNVSGIDINRDALRQQTAEGRILKRVRDSLDAQWGFNLHDQGRRTQVGSKPATISVLAPAYNFEVEINETREDAMQLIGLLDQEAQRFIPNQVGRYWDDFEPRAFGDNMQKWGTRTILIESGGLKNDREKQLIRKINFHLLLSALKSIADGSFEEYAVSDYTDIPNNSGRGFQELIVRNASIVGITRDVAFSLNEVQNSSATQYYLRGSISDVGDLSRTYGYFEFDASDFEVTLGKVHSEFIETYEDLKQLNFKEFRDQNIVEFKVNSGYDPYQHELPIKVVTGSNTTSRIDIGENPSLIFRKDGVVHHIVINGQLIDVSEKVYTTLMDEELWNSIGNAKWKVGDDIIQATPGSGPGYLVSKETFGDFELTLEFKPDATVNSGVFIRTQDSQNVNAEDAYEVNIWDDHVNQNFRTGAIVNFAFVESQASTIGKWNTYRIKAVGSRIEAWVNGTKTVTLVDDRNEAGHIALQLFDQGKIDFRNIRILEF